MPPEYQVVEFGPFRLFKTERLLLREGEPVPIGGRAFDILLHLVRNAGNVVSKQEILSQVWQGVTVDESSLRAHVASLRKALGDASGEGRYIINVAGRGYCFAHPVTGLDLPLGPSPATLSRARRFRPPHRITSMIDRVEDTKAICELLEQHRFVTIHGAGGIGKTTVAFAVVNQLLDAFREEVLFLDLGQLGLGDSVPDALASALDLAVHSRDPTPQIVGHLRDRTLLLMLDCCEHLIDAVAPLAEAIRLEAPRVSILSTSREPLRADGEHIYTLPPLAVPPDGVVLSAEEIHRYPAASLFLERARASGLRRMLSDGDAEVIADICRRVDGIALALELAAGRVSVHGLKGTASLLDGRLRLWQGRRTARTRHKTLNATLDWSYDLASVEEQIVLRRLSVLVGSFTLEEAETVAGGVAGDQGEVVEVVARLVAKSLVSADPDAEAARYRLMDTTRAYGRGKLFESGEEPDIARRHAIYFLAWLQRRHARPFGQWSDIGTINAIPLGNIRAALEWCASRPDETELHVELAAHSADLLLELSLLNESRRVCERALSALDVSKSSTRSEMILRGALGRALLLTDNSGGDTDTHFERALEISDALGDAIYRFRILNDLHIYYRRAALYHRLTPTAEQAMSIAVSVNEAKLTATASLMLGVSHHLVGNLAAAGVALRCSIQRQLLPGHEAAGIMDFRSKAHLVMAQTLWLQGFPDQAADTVREAERFEPANDLSTCQALIIAMEVFRLMRDWGAFEKRLDRLILLSRRANLEPYGWLGRGFQGELCLRSGEVDSGISIIRDAVGWLRADRFELFLPWLTCTLAHGLAIKGYQDQALDFVLGEIDILYERGGAYQLPELLRFHGDLLVGAGADTQAEAQYLQSIAVAKQQGALSWHLRTATSLARLWSRQGRRSDARKLLEGAYVNFTEGFGSEDAKAAKLLLDPSTEDGLPRQAG